LKKIQCATLEGIDALAIDIEASFIRALPNFIIVGLANSSIQESKERVKSALLVNSFKFPALKLTINLSPSDIVKSGTFYDLGIALLIALHNEPKDDIFEDFFIFGEVGLDGSLKDTKDIFVLVLSLAKASKIKNIFVPEASVAKLSLIPNINIYYAKTLKKACEFFTDKSSLRPFKNTNLDFNFFEINKQKYYYDLSYDVDFNEVKGQSLGLEAALIAVSGQHNIIYEGSAGCGKSMIIKRMKDIMPPMSLEEILEFAKLESLDNKEPSFRPKRQIRSPHHTSTKSSIFGGGSYGAKIGEIALANNGILFFDELPHFPKMILEALREPLEDFCILISRVNSKILYKTKFLFAAALNPCPCGNLLSLEKKCRCNELEINRYKAKLSEPFLDRIDMYVVMNEAKIDAKSTTSSKQMHEKVISAFKRQKLRGQENLNGKLSDKELKKYCILSEDAKLILAQARQNFALSYRSLNKILKVARTIADLENSDNILSKHLLKSISYRKR